MRKHIYASKTNKYDKKIKHTGSSNASSRCFNIFDSSFEYRISGSCITFAKHARALYTFENGVTHGIVMHLLQLILPHTPILTNGDAYEFVMHSSNRTLFPFDVRPNDTMMINEIIKIFSLLFFLLILLSN